jgi:hypothetical protein
MISGAADRKDAAGPVYVVIARVDRPRGPAAIAIDRGGGKSDAWEA